MPHSSTTKSKRAPQGMGSIRKVERTIKGKTYKYYEARYSAGFDPGTGKQIQRSITGKTQKEVAQKLKEAIASLDAGTYIAPSKMTVSEWLSEWSEQYLKNVKDSTRSSYMTIINTHLRPHIGAVRLDELSTPMVQRLYNSLGEPNGNRDAISAKTIKNVHGVLHKALHQAMLNGYIRNNPADAAVLPRIEKKQIHPMDEYQISTFLKAIRGHQYEKLFITMLFTGLRQGEALALTFDCVSFVNGSITVNKQLQLVRGSKGQYRLVATKNSKVRTIHVAPYVLDILRDIRQEQERNRAIYGPPLEKIPYVFCTPMGEHYKPNTVYKNFKAVVRNLGYDHIRLHDLRHSYAVASIRSGDDIKTVQDNLGHATASFTLDVYGHVTDQMKRDSAARMEQFIQSVNN